MSFQPTHAVAPYLLLAEFGAVLFGGSSASAGERITLEAIGAVRMAGPELTRRTEGATRQTEFRQAPDATAERIGRGISSHRD